MPGPRRAAASGSNRTQHPSPGSLALPRTYQFCHSTLRTLGHGTSPAPPPGQSPSVPLPFLAGPGCRRPCRTCGGAGAHVHYTRCGGDAARQRIHGVQQQARSAEKSGGRTSRTTLRDCSAGRQQIHVHMHGGAARAHQIMPATAKPMPNTRRDVITSPRNSQPPSSTSTVLVWPSTCGQAGRASTLSPAVRHACGAAASGRCPRPGPGFPHK